MCELSVPRVPSTKLCLSVPPLQTDTGWLTDLLTRVSRKQYLLARVSRKKKNTFFYPISLPQTLYPIRLGLNSSTFPVDRCVSFFFRMRRTRTLDVKTVKTGQLTGLLTGIQGWKCFVALSQTCYGSKSLKVILMDSNFGGHPVLNPLVTL